MYKIFIQGILIGAAKMIPGFSGSLLAINFGVYEKTLNIIANFKKINKDKLLYLFFLGIGIIIGIILFSYIVKFLLNKIYFPIMLLFIGLIIESLKKLFISIKGYNKPLLGGVCFVISFLFVTFISFNSFTFTCVDNIIMYFPLGIVESLTTLIPGISGTAIYMILGVYDLILDLYINITNFNNLFNLLFYFFGFLIGTILLAKFLSFLLKKFRKIMYISILGIMFSVICFLLINVFTSSYTMFDLILGIIFLLFGYLISNKLNHLF